MAANNKKKAVAKKTTKKKTTKKKAVTGKRKPSTGERKAYLPNRELYEEVCRCLERDEMSDILAQQLQLLVQRFGKKGNWANYTYNDDMQAYAMLMLVRTWKSFNPEKSQNPFAFFTQCVKNSFIQYLNQEKRQRLIRDELAVDKGLDPSYTYQMEYAEAQKAQREEEQEEEDRTEQIDLLSY